jgi:MSHA biogenesis protein MshP
MSATYRNHIRRRRGFALPSAIFLMVILAALGVFIVRINVMQTGSVTLDALGTHAYHAARAGIDWGAYQSLRNNSCVATTTLTFPAGSLAAFSATVTCVRTNDDELGVARRIDRITATACNQSPCPQVTPTNANYVERQISITVDQ